MKIQLLTEENTENSEHLENTEYPETTMDCSPGDCSPVDPKS